MTTKEYLNQIRKLECTINARAKQLMQDRKAETLITGIRYDGVHVQTSKLSTGFVHIEDRADKEAELIEMIRELQKKRDTIIEQITALDNPAHVNILVARYIFYLSFDEIAESMHRSYDRIIHLHGEALAAFRKKHSIF